MHIVIEILVLIPRILYYFLEALVCVFLPQKVKSIRGKVAVVTGAGRGIGRCIALELAKQGALVAVLDIDQTTSADTAREIEESGGTARSYQCDVTKTRDVSAVIARVWEDLGEIHLLVNNAGVLACKHILDLSEAEIRRTLEVNTVAQFWTVKEVLPSMIARNDGHIAVICSMSAKDGVRFLTDYCASKYGTNGFVEALEDDIEYKKATGVRLTTVYPLFVNTQLVTDFAHRAVPKDRFGKILTPEQVAIATVQGILHNQRYVYVPAFLTVSNVYALCPTKVHKAIKRFVGAAFYET